MAFPPTRPEQPSSPDNPIRHRCPICDLACSSQAAACPRCGHQLSLQSQTIPVLQVIPVKPNKSAPTAPLLHPARLAFLIDGQLLPLPNQPVLTLGRRTSDSHITQPDIDLTPFGAVTKGVSRLHSQLKTTRYLVYIVDLHSSNGTWLNGTRIVGERLLRNGDTVQLGQLPMTVQLRPVTW